MGINSTRRAFLLSLLLLLLLAASAGAYAQTPQPIESGKFRLHKFEQPIGEETYTITRDGDSLVTKSTFEFTDRGRRVPLTAELRTAPDLTPREFNIKGSVSRFSTIDSSVEIKGGTATIREDKETRQESVPKGPVFTISGYAPVTMQMMMVRYLNSHKFMAFNVASPPSVVLATSAPGVSRRV